MTSQHKSMRGTNRMYLLGRALPWIQMMDTRWGLMLPLVHHQRSRQSGVRTRASYSVRNQVFNRDSQGPSIHRGTEGTYSVDGLSLFARVQEKKRARWKREFVCVCARLLCSGGPRVPARTGRRGTFCQSSKDYVKILYLNNKTRSSKPMGPLRQWFVWTFSDPPSLGLSFGYI